MPKQARCTITLPVVALRSGRKLAPLVLDGPPALVRYVVEMLATEEAIDALTEASPPLYVGADAPAGYFRFDPA